MRVWATNFAQTQLECVYDANGKKNYVCPLPGPPGSQISAWADVSLSGGANGWSCYAPTDCDYKIRGKMYLVSPDDSFLPKEMWPSWNQFTPDHCEACNATVGIDALCTAGKPNCVP